MGKSSGRESSKRADKLPRMVGEVKRNAERKKRIPKRDSSAIVSL